MTHQCIKHCRKRVRAVLAISLMSSTYLNGNAFFPLKLWPRDMQAGFWKKPMGDTETFKLALFFIGNERAEKRARQIDFVINNADGKWFYFACQCFFPNISALHFYVSSLWCSSLASPLPRWPPIKLREKMTSKRLLTTFTTHFTTECG